MERILRDVLMAHGVEANARGALDHRWRILIKDYAERMITFDVPDGSPATIRTSLIERVSQHGFASD